MKFYNYLLLVLAFTLLSCERDDICALGTPTTPRLLIEFFNVADTENLKSVSRFSAYAELLITDENGVVTLPTTAEEAMNSALIFNVNANSIALPILINDDDLSTETRVIRYFFERNTNRRVEDDNTATNSDIDILQLTYIPEDVYVSRACGFKSIFNNFEIEILPGDDGNTWMSNFSFSEDIINEDTNTPTIENEDITHVQIFH